MTRPANLNALAVFRAAAEAGTFQAAAHSLGLTHGAVSQRIRQLEQNLGTPLFERHARGVTLTPAGAALHARVAPALAEIEAALAGRTAPLVLHTGASFAARWLAPRLSGWHADHPNLPIRTQVRAAPLNRALGAHEVAIGPLTGAPPPGARTQALTPLSLCALAHPALAAGRGPARSLEDLLDLPLLQDAHRRWQRAADAAGVPSPARLLDVDRSALALDAALGGHGVAIAPDYLAQGDIDAGRLAVLWRGPDPDGAVLTVAWSGAAGQSRALRRLTDWLARGFAG